MGNRLKEYNIKAWMFQNILIERYRYTSSHIEPLPPHAHDEYQIGLSLTDAGIYNYRGANYTVPTANLSILHSGEVHSVSNLEVGDTPSVAHMMYIPSTVMQQVIAEVAERQVSLPFIPTPIIYNEYLAGRFLELHLSLGSVVSQLEQDSLLLSVLTYLVLRYAQNAPMLPPVSPARQAVERVRQYLHDNLAQNVSLGTLSQIANLSSFHLCRLFRQEFGLPPHRYQIQIRIDRAKKLLIQGLPIGQVALETGFTHQNHFSGHFKRLVGTSPGKYLKK